MCVISYAGWGSKKETPDNIVKMDKANPDGIGFSCIDSGNVIWEKGITVERAIALVEKYPLPQVLHFRIKTVGSKRSELCHPFPILKNGNNPLVGSTNNGVLFHNGHWGDWKKNLLQMVLSTPSLEEFPEGDWSDSRAIALMVAYKGKEILKLISGGKFLLMLPNKVFYWGDFYDYENRKYSNITWNSTKTVLTPTVTYTYWPEYDQVLHAGRYKKKSSTVNEVSFYDDNDIVLPDKIDNITELDLDRIDNITELYLD